MSYQQQGYYGAPPPQGGYPPPEGYQQGYPPPGQPMYYPPQGHAPPPPPPQQEEKSHGCLYTCIATLCCCWLCGETRLFELLLFASTFGLITYNYRHSTTLFKVLL
ncbi:hypothetical protein HYQ46_003402 [Verticillium longisporum]|nr:hypothetical protein HYQ46_003402 [Verticillium longisporum]